jgi:hypothetical protein
MTDKQVLDLFDADNVSPALQRTRGSAEAEPVYFAGGYARSLEELQEHNEKDPIGKQLGGRRNIKGRGRRKSSLRRRSTYRRHRRSTYRRR